MANTLDDDRLVIESPDHVEVAVDLAGVGSRFLALAVDTVIQGALVLGVIIILMALSGLFGAVGLPALEGVFLAIGIGAVAIINFGYYIVCEMRMNGQTVGKRLVRIRVVKDTGEPIRFFDSALRNFVRVFEAAAGLYSISVVSVLISSQRKRLGDLAAGTIVVVASERLAPAHLAIDIANLPMSDELRRSIRAGIGAVTQEEYEFVTDLLARAAELPQQMATRMAVETGWKMMQKMGITPSGAESQTPHTYFVFLQAVAALYAQRSARA